MAVLCRPTLKSFLGSFAYSLVPAGTAGIVLYFVGTEAPTLFIVASGLMVAMTLFLLVQGILVHLRRVYFDDHIFGVVGLLGRSHVLWTDVTSAVLKERENAMSRTDHYLILRGDSSLVSYNASTLSKECETKLLEFVKGKVALVIERSKPAI